MISSSSILFLGFFIGMRHAVEADHLAAVASMVANKRSWSDSLRQGVAWGIGHWMTLAMLGGVTVLLGTTIPVEVISVLEALVGLMLLGLGADALRRLSIPKPGLPRTHSPDDNRPTSYRALLVGMVHGAAGSGLLVLLSLESASTPELALLYIVMFGAGSVAGMLVLTAAMIVPFKLSMDHLRSLYVCLVGITGIATIVLGTFMIWNNTFHLTTH